jgi:TolB-like protein
MKTQNSLRRVFLFLVLFIGSAAFCAAQNSRRLAILSFNGGSQDERDGIAELFSFTPQIMRNFTVIPRTTITRAIEKEQNFQLSSGMTDADTMARLGNQFGANYVMAGSITSLGSSRLLIVSIVKIDVIQQVAGAFLRYNSLDDFNKDGTIIEKMATELVSLMKKDTHNMDKLAVVPVQFSGGANERDGDALAQLLSIYLIQNGKYAVYPRTKTLEQVQIEYDTQLSGSTRDSEAVSIGRGINPQYVLSIVSRRIGSVNRFNASVIDLESGEQVDGGTEQYATLNDGINAINFLAKRLSEIQVTERERNRRAASVASMADAEEKARQAEERARQREEAAMERARKREAATDSFLRNSGIGLGGWFGWNGGGEGLAGGGEIELWLSRYFDLQTGLTVFQDVDKSLSEPMITQTIIQLPVLVKINPFPSSSSVFAGMPFLRFSVYGGAGINLFSIAKDITVQSPSQFSFTVGAELCFTWWAVSYQYNRDLSDTTYSSKGGNFSYIGDRHIFCIGIKWFKPFRKD